MAKSDDSRAYHREWMRKWRAAHREEDNTRQREWRANNYARSSFLMQRADAKRRGISFLLTFEEWLTIWLESGKLEQRGKLAGQYVMSRYGDAGPYAVGNVRICLFGDNVREAQYDKIVSNETRQKQSKAAKRNPQPRSARTGRFISRHGKNSVGKVSS